DVHCCVPLCQASSKCNSLLSFHTFPSDAEIRRKWLVAIRRDKFTVTPHTRVCSRHFNKDDVREPLSETGRRLLNKGAVPALFEWNNFTLPTSRPGHTSPTVLSKGCLEWLLMGRSHLFLNCTLVPSVTNRSRVSLEFSPF
uniref:THAP domain-containing protein 1 n=1 Tax=Oryzias sinensis TaxID=183150 RepID=A0A8C7Y661_9TELE